MKDNQKKVVLVTGASSGIGNACATYLAKNGYTVYGTSRHPEKVKQRADEFFEFIKMDVEDRDSILDAITTIIEKEKRIDVLICCAGMGISGPIEDTPIRDAIKQFNVNFFGVARTIKSVLPQLRENLGKIFVIGSVAGLSALPYQAYYSASKFALEGFMESLRMELYETGVMATIIDPADSRTKFTESRRLLKPIDDSIFTKNYNKALEVYERDEQNGSDPVLTARLIYKLMSAKFLLPHYFVASKSQKQHLFIRRFLGSLRGTYILNSIYEKFMLKYLNIKE